MDNLFSSTYKAYKFIFTDYTPVTNNVNIYYRYRVGTTDQTDSKYTYGGILSYFNGSSNSSLNSQKDQNRGRLAVWGVSNVASYSGQYEILMSDPKSTRSWKRMWYQLVNPHESGSYYTFDYGMSVYENNQAVDGIKFYCSSGNFAYLNYSVY